MATINSVLNSFLFWAAWIIIPFIMEMVPAIGNIFILLLIFTLEYIKEMINIEALEVYIYRVGDTILHKKL